MPVRSNELKLVLDVFSAEGEGTVIKNVRRTYIRSRNACNVKVGTYPVHLGVDPATSRALGFSAGRCTHLVEGERQVCVRR